MAYSFRASNAYDFADYSKYNIGLDSRSKREAKYEIKALETSIKSSLIIIKNKMMENVLQDSSIIKVEDQFREMINNLETACKKVSKNHSGLLNKIYSLLENKKVNDKFYVSFKKLHEAANMAAKTIDICEKYKPGEMVSSKMQSELNSLNLKIKNSLKEAIKNIPKPKTGFKVGLGILIGLAAISIAVTVCIFSFGLAGTGLGLGLMIGNLLAPVVVGIYMHYHLRHNPVLKNLEKALDNFEEIFDGLGEKDMHSLNINVKDLTQSVQNLKKENLLLKEKVEEVASLKEEMREIKNQFSEMNKSNKLSRNANKNIPLVLSKTQEMSDDKNSSVSNGQNKLSGDKDNKKEQGYAGEMIAKYQKLVQQIEIQLKAMSLDDIQDYLEFGKSLINARNAGRSSSK